MSGLKTTLAANVDGNTNEKHQGDYTLICLAIGKKANNPDLAPYTLALISFGRQGLTEKVNASRSVK